MGCVPSQPLPTTGRSECQSLGQSASVQSGTWAGAAGRRGDMLFKKIPLKKKKKIDKDFVLLLCM